MRKQVEDAKAAQQRAEETAAAKDVELRALREKISALQEEAAAERHAAETKLAEADARYRDVRGACAQAHAGYHKYKTAYEQQASGDSEHTILHLKISEGRMESYLLEHLDSEESFQCFVGPQTTCVHVSLRSRGQLRVKAKNVSWRG